MNKAPTNDPTPLAGKRAAHIPPDHIKHTLQQAIESGNVQLVEGMLRAMPHAILAREGLVWASRAGRRELAEKMIPLALSQASPAQAESLISRADSLDLAQAVSDWARVAQRTEIATRAEEYIARRTRPLIDPTPLSPEVLKFAALWAEHNPEELEAVMPRLVNLGDAIGIEVLLQATKNPLLGQLAVSLALAAGKHDLARQLIPAALAGADAGFARRLTHGAGADFTHSVADWAERAGRHDIRAALLGEASTFAPGTPVPHQQLDALCERILRSPGSNDIKTAVEACRVLLKPAVTTPDNPLARSAALWARRIAAQAQQEQNISLALSKLNAAVDLLIALGNMRDRATTHQVVLSASACASLPALRKLARNGIDLDTADVFGFNALHRACFFSQKTSIMALVEAGAQVNAAGREGYRCLHIAAARGDAELVRVLIGLGANRALCTQPQAGGLTALKVAAVLKQEAAMAAISPTPLVALHADKVDPERIQRDIALAGATLPTA